jgi:hypothetical protein
MCRQTPRERVSRASSRSSTACSTR